MTGSGIPITIFLPTAAKPPEWLRKRLKPRVGKGNSGPCIKPCSTLPTITRTTLSLLAISLGLQYRQFLNDLGDKELHHRIEADRREGHQLGVRTTPTFFVGGQRFYGKLTHSRLAPIIHSHLSRNAQPILSKVDVSNGVIYWGRGE